MNKVKDRIWNFEVDKRVRLEGESRLDRLVEGEKQFCWRKRNKRLNEFDHHVIKNGKERKLKVYRSWATKRKSDQAEVIGKYEWFGREARNVGRASLVHCRPPISCVFVGLTPRASVIPESDGES